jgi:uncharacterized protein
MKRLAIIIVGWCCLILGIAGLFLPVLQGWFFILLGLLLLSSQYAWAHQLLNKLLSRFPRLHAAIHKSAQQIFRWLGIEPVQRNT